MFMSSSHPEFLILQVSGMAKAFVIFLHSQRLLLLLPWGYHFENTDL